MDSQGVDPAYLPPGSRVGPWRVLGWGGRGTYGTVYRAEQEGHASSGPAALKLAHYYLHVPRLIEQGLSLPQAVMNEYNRHEADTAPSKEPS